MSSKILWKIPKKWLLQLELEYPPVRWAGNGDDESMVSGQELTQTFDTDNDTLMTQPSVCCMRKYSVLTGAGWEHGHHIVN